MKTNFFRALYGTCAGLAVFDRLRNQSFARACGHLLLMSVISAIIIGVGFYPALKLSIHKSLAAVVENCQGILCSNTVIQPVLEPEKSRYFMLHNNMSVTYLADNNGGLPEAFGKDCDMGILWKRDGRFVLWQALDGGKYSVVSPFNPLGRMDNMVVYGKDSLLAELNKIQPVRLDLKAGESETLTPEKLTALTDLAIMVGVGVLLLRKTLLEVIIYIGMFAGVTLLMNIGRPHRLPFKELIVLAIYAGFPPMLIGSVAEALELPYLSFNMIYVLGMTFYLIVIMNRLERLRQEQQWREEGV
ncbi:MAG: DUF1189 family protein [Lentisphaeria bacterium]|nr:DUF1189 family protein [Lentisphaeria bacterium]